MSLLDDVRQNYDWQIIFGTPPEWDDAESRYRGYGVDGATENPSNPITREVAKVHYALSDIRRVVAVADGENYEADWLGLFEMTDGRFLIVRAGCDYTGWDCQSSGSSEWLATEGEARACLTPREQERLFPAGGAS